LITEFAIRHGKYCNYLLTN